MSFLLLVILGVFTFSNELGLGGDYTTQAYRTFGAYDTLTYEWEEEDTLDVETEARGSWVLRAGVDGDAVMLDVNNTVSLSTRSARDYLSLWYEQQLGEVFEVRATNDAEVRHYHDWFPGVADTFYTGKDYWSNNSRLELRARPTEVVRIVLSDAVELLRYAEPDSYSYDYTVNRVRLRGSVEPAMFTTIDLEAEWSHRWARVADGRDYDEYGLRAGVDHMFDGGLDLGATGDLARRGYDGRAYSYRETGLSATAGYDFTGFGFDIEEDASWTWYDSTTAVYTSLFENSIELTANVTPVPELSVRLGPRYDAGRSLGTPGDDDYRELSGVAAIDYFSMDRVWVSVEDRLGWRRYPYADTSYQSNYAFNELSLFLNWTAISGSAGELRLEAMASISPEWHARQSDDFALAVYSAELKYGF